MRRKRPSFSMIAATVTLGFQTSRAMPPDSRRFAGVAADEVRHSRRPRFDGLARSGVAEPDVLAFTFDAPPEMNVGQHGNARFGQQPPAEFFRIGGADEPARFGDVVL